MAESEIKHNLQVVCERISHEAVRAGRAAESVRLLAVSKFHSVEAVVQAIEAGQRLFGENRVQEACAKFTAVAEKGYEFELHIIGQLQRNKVKDAVRIANCIESVDRIALLDEIEKQCAKIEKKMPVYFELHTGEETKSGFACEAALLEALMRCKDGFYPHVIPAGFMTMAPNTSDEHAVRSSFAALVACAHRMQALFPEFPLSELSMGMSQDYPLAISEGSTLVRIGTAIFGERSAQK